VSLTAAEMQRLEDDARAMAANNPRGYLSDALQCLRDTGDPFAPLALLRAMWTAGHARRDRQRAALHDAGQWLEQRLGRDPAISPDRLVLELGWLRRLVTIHGHSNGADDSSDDRHSRPPRAGPGRDEPAFGAHLDQLRRKRKALLARAAVAAAVHRGDARPIANSPGAARPARLPDSFEACFASWTDVLDAFKTARKRRRDQKPAKDRLLPLKPVAVELQPLAADLACSMLDTAGLDELEARTVANNGKLPSFWIAVADLVDRGGKRVPRRISFQAVPPPGDEPDPNRQP
jgi:hypothetical protein